MLSTKVEKVYEREVRVIKDGKEDSIRAESIVLAVGSQSNQKLLTDLEGKVPEILSVGDCVKPRKAREAIHEGFRAGLCV